MVSIQSFFDEGLKRELGTMSEAALIEKGLLRVDELAYIKNDPVYRRILESEDESLREETAKIIGLIRRYRPEMPPGKVADFYHTLFNSCKL